MRKRISEILMKSGETWEDKFPKLIFSDNSKKLFVILLLFLGIIQIVASQTNELFEAENAVL